MNPALSLFIGMLLFPVALLVSFLPRSFELSFGPLLGRFLMRVHRRKKVALENIQRCFPEYSSAQAQKLLIENYEHYGILIFEILHLFSPIPGHYKRYAQKISVLENKENWDAANAKQKGVLFVSSHLGNWEMMAAAGSLTGIPVTIVTKHLKPEWLHKKVESSRALAGIKGAYEPRPLPDILRAFRNKESVGFVLDQYAGPPIGVKVRFFGVKVGTLAAVGTLAKRTGAAIIPVKTFRDLKSGIIRVQIQPELDLNELKNWPICQEYEKDEEKITQALSCLIEKWVKEFPQQWLWIHRRFKNID